MAQISVSTEGIKMILTTVSVLKRYYRWLEKGDKRKKGVKGDLWVCGRHTWMGEGAITETENPGTRLGRAPRGQVGKMIGSGNIDGPLNYPKLDC